MEVQDDLNWWFARSTEHLISLVRLETWQEVRRLREREQALSEQLAASRASCRKLKEREPWQRMSITSYVTQ